MNRSLSHHTLIVLSAIIIGISLSSTILYYLSSSSVPFVDQMVQKEVSKLETDSNFKIAYATTTEGLLRCSDGKLASTQDQCPPGDTCPPPRNVGVSTCTRGGFSDLSIQKNSEVNTENSSKSELCQDNNRFTLHTSECPNSLIPSENETAVKESKDGRIGISTDKENYRPEEVVVMNVKNLGNQSLIFSDSKSDVIINNLNGNQTYEPSTLGTLALEPNGIKTYSWNQQDTKGQQVNNGNYSASISLGTLSANTTFTIS